MITYLLQSTICWVVFYAAYHILLKQETHFLYSRIYLLTAICLGLVIPLVDWPNYLIHQPESIGHLYITPFNTQMEQWDITVTAEAQTLNWYSILTTVYVLGILVAAGKLVSGWMKIRSIRRQATHIDHDNYTLVLTDHYHLPFSFLGSVYCSEEYYMQSNDIDQILAHEEYHVRALHSLDIIFLEILKVLMWFHPLIYLYKNELQQIHEYQADHAAYQLSSRKQYGKLLLSHVESVVPVALANHFFNSQLKNRFKMMTKKTSTRNSVWKYIVMLPMVVMTILLFSYSSQGKALIDKVIIMQDTLLPPPPPPVPHSIKEVVVVGYPTPPTADQGIPQAPPPPPPAPTVEVTGHKISEQQEVFRVVEQMPRFPGCEDMEGGNAALKKCADHKMLEFLYTHIRYPSEARKKGIEGNVVISFIVEADGSITNPAVVRDPGANLGEEALRVVGMMEQQGKWTPGKQRGQNVRVEFILPIKFELDKTEAQEIKVRVHPDDKGDKAKPIFVLNDKILGQVGMDNVNESIKPEDIESINVLKGKSAIDKYGEIGQNGVIEIYTKWQENGSQPNLHLTDVRLYPIPVANRLNINSTVENDGRYRLEIRNLKGQVTKKQEVNVSGGSIDTSMDLDGLSAGPYYLVITHQGKVFSQAFVKQ